MARKKDPVNDVRTKAAEVNAEETAAAEVSAAEGNAVDFAGEAENQKGKSEETTAKETVAAETKPVKKAGRPRKTESAVDAKTEVKASKAEKKAKEDKAEATGENIVIEFKGTQHKLDEIIDKVKNEWVAAGHRVSSIKSLDVYIKPEDYTAYYVINGKVEGKVWM